MDGCTFDQAILLPEFNLGGAHLIEASAGTGKTYNIQNIYARLVMERGLKVSEIEVMTYTEAATKELHGRLHAVLKDLQCRLHVPALDCPGKNEADTARRNQRADALIACVPQERRSAARSSVELALLEFDNASISTIHGFCQRILNRYAFDTGIRLSPELENSKKADLNTLAEKWWRMRPADAPAKIQLNTLKKFVQKLGEKADYKIVPPDVSTPEGYLLSVAQSIIEAYDAAAPNRAKMNFDDLLRLLYGALKPERPGSGALIEKLRGEFKAALIDEFQDTDPVQYGIFEHIFLNGNPNPLFFVGDPKQAIYSFRGGDIYTYLKAKSNPALQFGTLNVNYRSTSKLIEAVNAMFMDDADVSAFGEKLIGYERPVTVAAEPELPRKISDTPLRIVETPQKEMSVVLEVICDQILALLTEKTEGKPYLPRDIAVLTNSNDRNKEIQQLLRKRNIPGVISKSGNVFASQIAVELRLFLLAVADPSDKRTLLAALSTVFGGVAVDDLPQLDCAEALEPYLGKFAELCNAWSRGGLAALIPTMESSGYRERLAQRPDGERLLADIGQIRELAFAAATKIGAGIDAFLAWLTDRINAATAPKYGDRDEDDESDAEEYARTLESDENAVRIMTVHAAKGLQFPVVFLPDCWQLAKKENFKGKSTALSCYHDEGQLFFAVSDTARSCEAHEENLEKIRVLYVALTRAVERTVILTPQETGENEPLPRLLSQLEKRCKDHPPYEKVTAEPERSGKKYVVSETSGEERPAQNAPDFSSWRIPVKGSYSSLSPSMHDEADDDGRDVDPWSGFAADMEHVHPIFKVPEGAATGTCWHNILEKIPFNATEQELDETVRRELSDAGIDEIFVDVTSEMLRKVLDHPVTAPDGERFALNGIPWSKRMSEQGFDFSTARAVHSTQQLRTILEKHWKGDPDKAEFMQAMSHWERALPAGFMTGFIDLIFQHGEAFYVVDWKSNSLDCEIGNFDGFGVRREMAVHGYFFQYLLYAAVLHTHLKQTLGAEYRWEKHFGGVFYYFLRGIAAGGKAPVYADRPSEALLDELAVALGLEK